MKHVALLAVLLLAAVYAPRAPASETDQYLTWGVELKDSAPAMNAFLNEELQKYLVHANWPRNRSLSADEISIGFFKYLFEGLYKSRIRHWCFTSPDADRYPPNDVSPWGYQRASIYRKPAFPYVLPMARTIRLGDVYMGIDKISHIFGFGQRYYTQYIRKLAEGAPEEEALRSVIETGNFQEATLLGQLVCGVFSYADLEANYQGMMLARQLASGTEPCFAKDAQGLWTFQGAIDITAFITPAMDESWNNSHYGGMRKRNVLSTIASDYCNEEILAAVAPRFERYAQYPKSRSQLILEQMLDESGEKPQRKQSIAETCDLAERLHNAADMAPHGQ